MAIKGCDLYKGKVTPWDLLKLGKEISSRHQYSALSAFLSEAAC